MWAPILFLTMIPGNLPAAGAIEVSLEYVRGPDEEEADSPFLHRGELILETLDAPPAGEWKLPELVSARPLYAMTALGDHEVLFVLDRAKADDPFYSRVYFDANANGDLTDDPVPVLAEDWIVPGYYQAVPLDITLKVDGAAVPYCLQIVALSETVMLGDELEDDFDLEEISFNLYGHCCYAGELRHGGKTYRVQLGDDNVNGRFDETVSYVRDGAAAENRAIETTGDLLFLSGDGELNELDISCLGTHLVLGNELFEVDVDGAAKRLKLTPVSGAQGTVKLPVDPKRLSLAGEKDGTYLMLHEPRGQVKVPPGEYRVAGYQLERKDPQGDLWFLSAVATPGSPTVPVAAGGTAELAFGEPFIPGADVLEGTYEAFKKKKLERVEVEFAIIGHGLEVVNDLRHVSGHETAIPLDGKGDAPLEPRYKIVDVGSGGKVVDAGSFEYG